MLLCAESGFEAGFNFEPIATVVSVRLVQEGAQAGCIGTAATIDMLRLRGRSALRSSVIGVRNVI